MQIRPAEQADIEPLTQLWQSGWREVHETLLPADLVALRTEASFRDRLQAALPHIRIAGPVGAPIAFHMLKGDELNQFYVAAEHRGTGVAAVLMADAERELLSQSGPDAWLSCAMGNDRAARFYERLGWSRVGAATVPVDTSAGPYDLEIWRYEKRLA